ncbi:MAG: AAA family ATPase [Chromatiales bacterium]
MSDITSEIIEWLMQRPAWQQKAAEWQLEKGELSDSDINEITTRLKSPTESTSMKHQALAGLRSSSQTTGDLRLVSIGNIKGIESLEPYRPLDFGDGNLSVIYGHNGSGKSGYTRILRNVCGHPRAEPLRPNIFKVAPKHRQCTVTYQVGPDIHSEVWLANADPIEWLRAVDIFDAEAAAFYLSNETGVTYTPPQIALFEHLSTTCDRVKAQLRHEQGALQSTLPQIPAEYANTATAKSYQSLNPTMSGVALHHLKTWTESEQKTLDGLTERLKTADPTAAARQQRQIKVQVDQLISRMKVASSALSKEQLERIRYAQQEALSKRQIATEAAKIQSAQLDGVGTETWRALWEAARKYSVDVAYPGREFPATNEGDRCVLCHQDLAPDARKRLQDFDSSIKGLLENAANNAETTYSNTLAGLPSPMNSVEIMTACTAAGLDDSWSQALTTFWNQIQQVCERLKVGETQEEALPIVTPKEILETLQTYSDSLETRAQQFDQDASQFDHIQAASEKLNLEAKRWTAQQSSAIDAEIMRLMKVAQYESWIASTNSQSISRKAGEFAQKAITEAYVHRFNTELKNLGASHINVALVKTRTDHGVAMHRLQLVGTSAPSITPIEVLSEGERRIVSLAAFLADVGDKPLAAPFVFDDPISSLDQEYEWSVAQRLAQLARERQVLIFTHRLSLFGAAEDAAKKMGEQWKKDNLEQRFIQAYQGISGHPVDESLASVNTKKANNILLERLKKAKSAGNSEGPEAYERHAQVICTEFRKLLERTVEDDLLNQVIKRHRRSVQTDNRLGALPRITPEDCQFIDGLMTKYSAFEHSQSTETQVRIPGEAELRADLEQLSTWRRDFSSRPAEPLM